MVFKKDVLLRRAYIKKVSPILLGLDNGEIYFGDKKFGAMLKSQFAFLVSALGPSLAFSTFFLNLFCFEFSLSYF